MENKVVGITNEQAIVVNEIREQIVKIVDTHTANIKQYEFMLEYYKNQKWFLEISVSKSKAKGVHEKYSKLKNKLTSELVSEINATERSIVQEKDYLQNSNEFLEIFDSQVDFTQTETENVFTYKAGFFELIIQFAKTFGLTQLA